MAICIFPKLCFCFQAKANTLCYIHCQKSWICLFFYRGHFELSKCLSIELYLRWASLICCPKHQREICKSLKFELCTVPIFLIWSLSSRLVYWSIHFSFPTHEKYVTITGLLYLSSELNAHPSNLSHDYRWFL